MTALSIIQPQNSTATAYPPLTRAPREPVPRHLDWHMGALMRWHLMAEDSGGLLALSEVVARPGCEPPTHVHAREDEIWFILEGEVLFQLGLERILGRAGATVYLPRGVPHGFAVLSATARMLHLYTPAGIDAVFHAMSEPARGPHLPPGSEGPPDAETLARLEQAYGARGVTFVGPPLAVALAAERKRGVAITSAA